MKLTLKLAAISLICSSFMSCSSPQKTSISLHDGVYSDEPYEEALEQNTSLGSGHKLSLKDLEIRGAGSIFGYKQSGHIASVGYQMYCDLLAEELTKKRAPENQSYKPTKITCNVATEIPPSYIENPSIRLNYYHKISSVVNLPSVDKLEGELVDVFGQFTYEVNNLLNLARVKLLYSIYDISIYFGIEIQKSTESTFRKHFQVYTKTN